MLKKVTHVSQASHWKVMLEKSFPDLSILSSPRARHEHSHLLESSLLNILKIFSVGGNF